MLARSRQHRAREDPPADGLAALVAAEARLASEMSSAREEAAAILAAARRAAGEVPASVDVAAPGDTAAIDEDLARELGAVEADLARRLAAHAAARGALDDLASFAIERLLARVAQRSGP